MSFFVLSVRITAVVVFLGFFNAADSLSAAQTEPERVLALYSFKNGIPWERLLNEGLQSRLVKSAGSSVELNIEHMDLVRFSDETYQESLKKIFRLKYSSLPVDLVIPMEDEAAAFVRKYGDEIFPGVPVLFSSIEPEAFQPEYMEPHMTGIYRGEDFRGTMDLILKLLPDRRHLYVISGTALTDRNVLRKTRIELAPYSQQIAITYITDFSIETLLETIGKLPERSAILYLILLKDRTGRTFVPREILGKISQTANAPVFSLWDSYLGYGIVGGSLSSAERIGNIAADIGLQILNGKRPAEIPPKRAKNVAMFDWRQLKRWEIREALLPPDSIIRFERLTFYQRYKGYVISGIVFVVAQSALVVFLLVSRLMRKRAVRALEKSEKRSRNLFERASDGAFLLNMDGTIVDVNERMCESLGYSRQELLKLKLFDIDTHYTPGRLLEDWQNIARDEIVTLVGRYKRKDGTSFPVEVRAGKFETQGVQTVLALVRDISLRRKAEKEKFRLEFQLQQAQRMEAIGTLAGGISHDFNNILAPIIGYADLARASVPEKSPAENYIGEILKAAKRARDLVKQILTFSRQSEQRMAPIRLQPIVKESLKLLRASIPTTIEISRYVDPDCGTVAADPTQIHQVMMNLCTNAYQAMRENGGVMTVSLKETELGSDFARHLNLPPGKYVLLEVKDTGCGMDSSVRDRIFEPYFTTREKGKGTGLGLSVVHGIVKRHNGLITVTSEVGKGTTFDVYFPRTDSPAAEPDADSHHPKPIPSGHERVLVIDDESVIIDVLRYMLETLGYRVTALTSSPDALKAFQSHPHEFDLVITDMTMPHMTGIELADRLMKIRSDIPIIMCTGYSESIDEKKAETLGISKYLTKPVGMETLAETVREVLNRFTKTKKRSDRS